MNRSRLASLALGGVAWAIASTLGALVPIAACETTDGPPASSASASSGAADASAHASSAASVTALSLGLLDSGVDGRASLDDTAGVGKGDVLALGFASNGALLVQTERAMIEIGADAARSEVPLPSKAFVVLSSRPADVIAVAVDDNDVRLLTLVPLAEVYRGHGRPIGDPLSSAVETPLHEERDVAVVVVPPGSKQSVRLVVPSGMEAHAEGIDVTKSGHYAVLTLAVEDNGDTSYRAFSYELPSGRRIAEVTPSLPTAMQLPTTTLDGDLQIGFRNGEIVAVDLATGATVRHAPFGCKSLGEGMEPARGNPIVDPSGTKLIATCNSDGVLLDLHTLKRIRSYPHLVPGCDNGWFLPAHFAGDGKQLVLEGCGGESHLDISTGRFLCGDGDGLMGSPYEDTGLPMGARGRPHRPPQAIGVPRCNSEEANEITPVSTHYRVDFSIADESVLIGPNGVKIPLGSDMGVPVVSPAEDRFAMSKGARVVVRALPSGSVISDTTF